MDSRLPASGYHVANNGNQSTQISTIHFHYQKKKKKQKIKLIDYIDGVLPKQALRDMYWPENCDQVVTLSLCHFITSNVLRMYCILLWNI